MIIHHQTNHAAFAGNHVWYWLPQQVVQTRVSARIVMAALVNFKTVVIEPICITLAVGDMIDIGFTRVTGSDTIYSNPGLSHLTIEGPTR